MMHKICYQLFLEIEKKIQIIFSFALLPASMILSFLVTSRNLEAQDVLNSHHPGENCMACHPHFKIGGTVFTDTTAASTLAGVSLSLVQPEGGEVILEHSDKNGNLFSAGVSDGKYLVRLGSLTSRTWHQIPEQGSCNICHLRGGNGSSERTKRLHQSHTSLPVDNDCRHCHHFPASMSLNQLMTSGVLNAAEPPPIPPGSQVEIAGRIYPFNPSEHDMKTVRPDIFAPGHFSMFDVILAVAKKNGIPVEYAFDESRQTHFITKINQVSGDFWYHFSYDAGSGNRTEINYKRANRWDEALWRPGVWIKVVRDENVAEIKQEYLEEINREKSEGHVIPQVQISINPSSYQGNPSGSGRITVNRQFQNVKVAAHNLRATGYPSPYSKPFQPGVVTALDVLLSLMDQGKLNLVTSVFYTYFAQHYIDSYYVVALGFPEVGTAHASGRQGFVYITENGTFNRLPNDADRKLHITSDILAIHAPDFSYWRWAELGNPYYEAKDPITSVEDPTILEDYHALSRGFNLHAPYPNPFTGSLKISFNIFEPGKVNLSVYNMLGQKVETLFVGKVRNLGIHTLQWQPKELPSGMYFLKMRYENHSQIRSVAFVK